MALERLLVLATEVSQRGGVEAYTSALLSSLDRICPSSSLTLITLKKAPDSDLPARFSALVTPNKYRYVFTTLLESLRRRPSELIVGHVHLLPLGIVAARLCGAKISLITYGVDISENRKHLHRVLATRVDRFISISRATALSADIFLARRLRRRFEAIQLLPPTYDADRFFPNDSEKAFARKRIGLDNEDLVLITVGRLASSEARKGHDRVIMALTDLRVVHPTIKYLVIGDGDDSIRLRKLAHAEHVEDIVRFTGFQSDLQTCYLAADLFVMPSTQEGFGIVFIEALACGIPVVAGGIDGSTQATLWGEVAFLCDPFDQSSVTRAVGNALDRIGSDDLRTNPTFLHRRIVEMFGPDAFDARLREVLTGNTTVGNSSNA